jgi:glycosyltransferase involved in cell wall biosynthesis
MTTPTSRPSVCFVGTGPVVHKVLASDAPDQIGGAELQLKEIAFRLADRGWPISFVVGDYGQESTCLHPDIRVLKAHAPHEQKTGIRFLTRDLPRFLGALDQADADIYFQYGVGGLTGAIAWFARKHRRRFAFWMASDSDPQCRVPGASRLPRSQRWPAYQGMRRADVLLAQSTGQQALAREHLGCESELLPNIWPGPYELSPPQRTTESVLWVGSIRSVKRPLLMVELAAKLPDIPFTMVGGVSRGDEQLYEQLVAAAGQRPNLDFRGFVPPNEVDRHYAQAALLVCTSAVEGFPNTFLHAWGRGRPVVTTYDPAGLVAQENLGVAVASVPEAAAAVRSLWDTPERCQEIGARASRYVQAHHHPDVIIGQLEQLFQRLQQTTPAG